MAVSAVPLLASLLQRHLVVLAFSGTMNSLLTNLTYPPKFEAGRLINFVYFFRHPV